MACRVCGVVSVSKAISKLLVSWTARTALQRTKWFYISAILTSIRTVAVEVCGDTVATIREFLPSYMMKAQTSRVLF